MTSRSRKAHGCLLGLAFAGVFSIGADEGLLSFPSAEAVVGRPLTPVSYAGVARRTTRRTVYAGAAYGAAAYGSAAYGASTVYNTLPANCSPASGVVYDCGDETYRAVYDGPEVVYVVDD